MRYKLLFFLLLFIGNSAISQVFPKNVWGVYTWGNYSSKNVNPISTPLIKGAPLILPWRDLEPTNGKFEFDKLIKQKLIQLDANDYYTTLMVWVACATTAVTPTDTTWAYTPPWLFKNGVPLVKFPVTKNALGQNTTRYFPYYLDENYKFYFHRMIDALGNYICSLPDNLKKRILFVQSAEGSTGDGGPYKGNPLNSMYNITDAEWSTFRIETWAEYVSAFSVNGEPQLTLLTNSDANEETEYNWMLENLPNAMGLHQGMFSHGYDISDAQERLADFIAFRNAVEAKGEEFFAYGEEDAEWETYGWSTQNTPQAFYWSALYATHCGLSIWSIPPDAFQNQEHFPAFILFNRYANQVHPQTADYAFCALRRGLDASDTISFPTSIYGAAKKNNVQRYINIADAFKEYGAQMGDPEKATGNGMINRQSQDYNDAGWQTLPGNYQRHLTQIEPNETSVGWWSVDKSIYGRFARGFDAEKGKNTMYFDLDDDFFGENKNREKSGLKIKVIYNANDGGSWELLYHATNGNMKTAFSVTNGVGQGWCTKEVTINDAYLNNGGLKGADFILQNTGTTNCRFHLIEIDKSDVKIGSIISQLKIQKLSTAKIWSTKDQIHFLFPGEEKLESFKLDTVDGKTIFSENNLQKNIVDIPNCLSGIYLVVCTTNEGIYKQKIKIE